MTESKRHRAGSWWGRPGAPIGLVLCTTVAATIVLTVILVIWPFGPRPKSPQSPPAVVVESKDLKAIASEFETWRTAGQRMVVESEDLTAIARAVTAPQNLSITVKIDEEQLQAVVAAAREAMQRLGESGDSATETTSGTRDIASNAKRVADSADDIAGDTRDIAGGVNRVADGVVGIVGKMDNVVGGVKRVADSADDIAGDMHRVADSAADIAGGTRDIAGSVNRVADGVVGIAGKMDGVVGGVKRVADSADDIASDVHRVADGVIGIADKVDDIADRIGRHDGLDSPRPRLLENWIGAVTFAHASVSFDGCEEVAESLNRKIKNTKRMVEQQCVLVIGYANTLGNEPYNDYLSESRADLVAECLKDYIKTDGVGSEFDFETISMGERENKNNLHYPDSWYRAVDVYHYSSAGSCLSQAVGR